MGNDQWVSLVEFSVRTGISLSTLRRYIKAGKVDHKLIEGRYLIKDDGAFKAPKKRGPQSTTSTGSTTSASASIDKEFHTRLKALEKDLRAANEEIAELKTLVAFYEEKWSKQSPKK